MLQESNTLSPVSITYEDLPPVFGKAVFERHRGKLTEMGGFLDVLDLVFFTPPIAGLILLHYGWRTPFVAFGVIGLLVSRMNLHYSIASRGLLCCETGL